MATNRHDMQNNKQSHDLSTSWNGFVRPIKHTRYALNPSDSFYFSTERRLAVGILSTAVAQLETIYYTLG